MKMSSEPEFEDVLYGLNIQLRELLLRVVRVIVDQYADSISNILKRFEKQLKKFKPFQKKVYFDVSGKKLKPNIDLGLLDTSAILALLELRNDNKSDFKGCSRCWDVDCWEGCDKVLECVKCNKNDSEKICCSKCKMCTDCNKDLYEAELTAAIMHAIQLPTELACQWYSFNECLKISEELRNTFSHITKHKCKLALDNGFKGVDSFEQFSICDNFKEFEGYMCFVFKKIREHIQDGQTYACPLEEKFVDKNKETLGLIFTCGKKLTQYLVQEHSMFKEILEVNGKTITAVENCEKRFEEIVTTGYETLKNDIVQGVSKELTNTLQQQSYGVVNVNKDVLDIHRKFVVFEKYAKDCVWMILRRILDKILTERNNLHDDSDVFDKIKELCQNNCKMGTNHMELMNWTYAKLKMFPKKDNSFTSAILREDYFRNRLESDIAEHVDNIMHFRQFVFDASWETFKKIKNGEYENRLLFRSNGTYAWPKAIDHLMTSISIILEYLSKFKLVSTDEVSKIKREMNRLVLLHGSELKEEVSRLSQLKD